MADTVPKVVEAERFVLRDSSGEIRAVLGTRPDGAVSLGLIGRAGKIRAALSVEAEDVAALALGDPAGIPRAALRVDGDGTASLNFLDRAEKTRAGMRVNATLHSTRRQDITIALDNPPEAA